MSGKSNPYRFTLQFNKQDHRQGYVADLLNSMGRLKGQYITDAILHYVNCTKEPVIEQDKDEIFRQKIELIVKQILEKNTRQDMPTTGDTPERKPMRRKTVEVLSAADTTSEIDEQHIKVILASLDSFNKN